MEAEQWGVRAEIVDHRVLLRWWVRDTDGQCCDGLASPGAWIAQLRDVLDVAEAVRDLERHYELLIASGQFRSLDEIDELCEGEIVGLSFSAAPAPRVHD